MNEGQERSAPGLDEDDPPVLPEHALHFRKSLIEIVRQSGEMVQAALNDEDVLAAIGEGKFAAISNRAFRGAFELRDQTRREVHAFDARESETLERNQTVSAAAKKFDNFRVARPVARAQTIEAYNKFLNLLFRRFKP